MTHVVGVDPSLTSTGLVFEDYETGELVESRFRSKLPDPERMLEIRDFVLAACVDPNPLVVIEGFAYGAKGKAVFQVAGLGWILRAAFVENRIPYVEATPSTLKKFATGKGSGGKDLTISAVSVRTGRIFESNDVVDALVCFSIGRELASLPHPLGALPKSHLAALDAVELPEV